MSDKKINVNGSIGFPGLLTLLFIYLKMTGQIAWSWLWVLSPLWIGFVAALLVLAAVLIFVALSK